jgi:hypothetical protein
MTVIPKTSPFRWTEPRRAAALDVAMDELSDAAIAERAGVSRRSLTTWKQHPEFAAQVAHHIEDLNRAMTRLAIAKKHKRVAVLNDLHEKALEVIRLRAEQFTDADTPADAARRVFGNGTVPEAITGLVVKDETITNSGIVSTKWSVDVALMKEIRSLEEQAAKELGQWVDRSEVESTTTVVRIVGVDTDAI